MTHVPWHPGELEPVKELKGIESVELTSVGIDIGTTTTHLMFSRLLARRSGDEYSSKFHIVERETVYESPIILTPYSDGTTIDTDAVDAFVQEIYGDAGYSPADVDTGAVIVTGEASRKKNADAIANLFSEQAGKFVCATAGANLEALMSAHGSGAVDYSVDNDEDVLHMDIGGGTTKFAYIVDGFIEDTASINVGARLVEFEGQQITRFEDAAEKIAGDVGLELEVGAEIRPEEKERLADRFAELLFELVEENLSPLAEALMVTELPDPESFDVVTFSGGGAEYIYDRETGFFNDIGPELGNSIRNEVTKRELVEIELSSGIRATALGSTQHTVQVSGNTILISEDDILPLRNIPMVPFVANHDDDVDHFTETILEKLDLYDVDKLDEAFAFGFHLHGDISYDFLKMIVDGCISGWREFDGEHPIILAFDTDIAMNTGKIVTDLVDSPVIAIDGVELDQFGYIDIGEPLEDTNAVPLTVKSLLFEG